MVAGGHPPCDLAEGQLLVCQVGDLPEDLDDALALCPRHRRQREDGEGGVVRRLCEELGVVPPRSAGVYGPFRTAVHADGDGVKPLSAHWVRDRRGVRLRVSHEHRAGQGVRLVVDQPPAALLRLVGHRVGRGALSQVRDVPGLGAEPAVEQEVAPRRAAVPCALIQGYSLLTLKWDALYGLRTPEARLVQPMPWDEAPVRPVLGVVPAVDHRRVAGPVELGQAAPNAARTVEQAR